MKWFKIGLLTGLIIATVAGFTLINTSNKGYKFYYYPELNAYYDVQKEKYIYSVDGAKTWEIITKQSKALPSNLGKRITIHSPIEQIWHHNEEHRRKYDGILTDLMANESNSEDKKEKKSEKKKINSDSSAFEQKPAAALDSMNHENEYSAGENLEVEKKEKSVEDHSAEEADQPAIEEGISEAAEEELLVTDSTEMH